MALIEIDGLPWKITILIEGSLEVKLPTIWRDEKAVSREKSQKRKDQKKEDAGARKGRKVAKHCVFSWFCGSGGLKSRLAKAAGAGRHLGRWEMKSCTPLWRKAHLEVKCVKNWGVRTTFGSWDVEKVHAVVAWSTCRSENVQNTPGPDHFWQLRCRKSARRCGAKHISKWKCTKHTPGPDHFWQLRCRKSARRCGAKHISKWKCTKHHMFAPLLEVQISKKCTPLWREVHFEVKMHKALGVRTTFGGSDVASLRFGSLHYTIHYTTVHYTKLHSTTLQLQLQNYTTTLHYTPVH